ncbi:unnamed protein product [Prorocentrum cordatum]|uniref:Uncharacterized protein n=1 Tax=Prorocentrum cordatum TaxID=2364126 RepID=A0ABN9SS63_9DINO|nr:unnamed protein product [Polarella glacialis]
MPRTVKWTTLDRSSCTSCSNFDELCSRSAMGQRDQLSRYRLSSMSTKTMSVCFKTQSKMTLLIAGTMTGNAPEACTVAWACLAACFASWFDALLAAGVQLSTFGSSWS